MNETRWERWGAASGFAVLVVGAAATVFERGAVSPGDPAALTVFYARNRDALLAQSLLFLIGAGIFLWYVGSLRSFLARAEGGTGGLSAIAFGAGIAWTAVSVAAQASQIGLAMGSSGEVQPALVGMMMALFIGANLLLAVMLFAVAAVSFRTKCFPAWLSWLSVVAAAANLVPLFGFLAESGPLAPDGWITAYGPYPVFAVWLVSATVVMLRRIGTPTRGGQR